MVLFCLVGNWERNVRVSLSAEEDVKKRSNVFRLYNSEKKKAFLGLDWDGNITV